jgi:hypothetical protein
MQTSSHIYSFNSHHHGQTIQEDESLQLYEEDGDWSLVGRHLQDSSRGVGYVPTTYIGTAENRHDLGQSEEPVAPTSQVAQTHASYPGSSNQDSTLDSQVVTWSVTVSNLGYSFENHLEYRLTRSCFSSPGYRS